MKTKKKKKIIYKSSILQIHKITEEFFLGGVPVKGYVHVASKLFLDFVTEVKKALWECQVTNDAIKESF